MRTVLVLALLTLGCSRIDTPQDSDVFEIGQHDADVLGIHPQKFHSPIAKQHTLSIEDSVDRDLHNLTTAAMRADQTIETVVGYATWILERQGYTAESKQLWAEYHARFAGYMLSRDIGDHAPLIAWLAAWYDVLEQKLGPEMMRTTRLEHIKILNYSIPVVFDPKGEYLDQNGELWDLTDYLAHFAGTRRTLFFVPLSQHDGFAGVVTYWAVWAGCTGATQGIGGLMPFLCSPVGELSNFIMGKYIAPTTGYIVYCSKVACTH